ncbi:MAG: hypothetical protein LBD73_04610 [Deferribacteraceae bacterium]|jgi:hypothetical protein|nr:hypothetical protein [Deferribacteraceae bacterium]
MKILYDTSSAITWSLFQEIKTSADDADAVLPCARFVDAQAKNLLDYIRPAFLILAIAINFLSLLTERGLFCRIHPDARKRVISRWNKIPGPGRDFIFFYKTLTAFYIFSNIEREGRLNEY